MRLENLSYFVACGETRALNDATRRALRGNFIELSDGVTHYELAGPSEGELVLLMPDLTLPLFYWDELANWLHAMGLRTLAYSAYGRGYSDRVSGSYGPALFMRQAQELLSKLGQIEVAHVIGASMGALISMGLIQQAWFRTRTLTLISPLGLECQLPILARASQFNGLAQVWGRYTGLGGVVRQLDMSVRTTEQASPLKKMVVDAFCYEGSMHALLSTYRAFPMIHQQALYLNASQVPVPILLLWGDEDRITPSKVMADAKSLLRPVDARLIPQCGHMAPVERPELVARVFSYFRKSTMAPSS